MEDLTNLNPEPTESNDTLCVNCHVNKFEGEHATKLCRECRNKFINFPIPKWIVFFAAGLLAVIAISLIRTRLYISAAIHLGKAEKAIEHKHFSTAENELALVLEQFPDDIAANADMIIAGSYNQNAVAVNTSFNKVAGKDLKDEELLAKVNAAMDYIGANYPGDTTTIKKITAASGNKENLLAIYKQADTAAAGIKLYIANGLFDIKDYTSAEKISIEVLNANPDFYQGLSLMAAIKRNTAKYEEALQYCDRMLAINNEDVYAIGQKARIELKRKHDKQAAIYAAEAMKINPDNDLALEAQIMVDHFAGRKNESISRLGIIKTHAASSGDSTVFNRLSAIINGSEIYR